MAPKTKPNTTLYSSRVVALIRKDMPGAHIAENPTMTQLALYGRLAGVDPAVWLRG